MDKLRGLNGTIVLKEDCVQILREKALDSTFHEQEKIEIPYSEIKDIYFEAGSLINGYLSILRVGASKLHFAPPSGHRCVCQWPPGVGSGRG